MTSNNTSSRYGSLSIALHWFMLVLMVGIYASMELREVFPKGSDARAAMKQFHYILGLGAWALVWVRLLVRWGTGVPAITPTPSPWQAAAATWGHRILYIFMLAMPLMGWLTLSAQGHAVVLGGLSLPTLIEASKPLAEQLKDVHEFGATLGYLLIGGHAAAALFHHHVLRDNTLVRMLPLWLHAEKTQ
jgi:superoxide oxidase